MNLCNTFRDRLTQNSELSEAGNANLELYREAFDPSITSTNERGRFLYLDKEGGVLVVNDQRSVTLIHSITNLGGTFACREDKLVCLQGLTISATPLIIKMESLTKTSCFDCPKLVDFESCETTKALADLKPVRNSKFECSSSIILAPFQLKCIAQSDSKNPLDLILELKKAAEDFDENKEELVNSAAQHNKYIYSMLWGVHKNLISEGTLLVYNDDEELRAFAQKRHTDCILPAIPPGAPLLQVHASDSTLNQLSIAISNMNKTNEKTNALRALEFERVKEKDDEKKDRTKKWIHESVQQMIFNAMLEDGERQETSIKAIPSI
jgi:hypothetical protein